MTPELKLSAEEIIQAVHGQCLHEQNWAVRGISVDKASVKPGDLFIALRQENNDGHNDIAAAFEAGAVAAIISRQVHVGSDAPLIFVADTLKALENLGAAARKRSPARIIGVSGATECKDMLHLMLNEIGETFISDAQSDDHLDVTLSLTKLPMTSSYGVFEINANNPERFEYLSRHIQPHIALIATSANNLDDFPSLIDGKATLFNGMPSNGMAVLDRGSPDFIYLSTAAKMRGLKKILGYGHDSKSDARLLDYVETNEGTKIRADIMGRKIRYDLGAPGLQAALHSVGTLCAIVAAGGDAETCAHALSHYRPSKKYDVIERIDYQEGGFILIDKSGDTDIADLRFTLRVLGQMQPGLGGQRFLVLGETSATLPPNLMKDIVEAKIAAVFCYGSSSAALYEALPAAVRGYQANTSDELARHVARCVEAGDIVAAAGMGISEATEGMRWLETRANDLKKTA